MAGVECCYGAQMYAAGLIGIDIPICQSYSAQGAYGYFGSTTIAYGESRATVAADLIVQYFLLEILDGASLGRAALRARQRYVREMVDLDPTDLKTLAQFTLLGDPAVHPVKVDVPAIVDRATDGDAGHRQRRRERRAKLAAEGAHLQASRPDRVARGQAAGAGAHRAPRARGDCEGRWNPGDAALPDVRGPRTGRRRAHGRRCARCARWRAWRKPRGSSIAGRRFFVAIEKPSNAGGGPHAVAVVVKEVAGRIVDVRRYEQR